MRALLRSVAIAVLVLASTATVAADLTIRMQKEAFVPAKATLAVGTRVTWTNTDTVPHSVTADDKRFDSGPIAPGKTFTWTADKAGALPYHCIFHPSMNAVLNVAANAHKPAH